MRGGSGETIAAVATAQGVAAVAIVRLSGPQALAIASTLAGGAPLASHRATVRRLRVGDELLDEAVLLPFKAPRSFTGEDVVELQCHGGVVTSRRVLEAALALGARLAEPGEFTARALANGRVDLTQAEALADVIHAQSDAAHREAQRHLAGALSASIDAIKAPLVELVTLVEAAIDFSTEEHVYSLGADEICARLERIGAALAGLLSTYGAGRMRREGVRVAIVGRPNAGKSTLFNYWLRTDRALVTDVPGTTRDTLEEGVDVDGVRVLLIDTAGVRATDDRVESLGIARTWRASAEADAVVWVVDGAAPDELAEVAGALPDRPTAVVWNKLDLCGDAAWPTPGVSAALAMLPRAPTCEVRVSLHDDPSPLRAVLPALVRACGVVVSDESPAITRVRHLQHLEGAAAALARAGEAAALDAGHELVALDLRIALDELGALTGAVTTDAILARIFGEFCVGK